MNVHTGSTLAVRIPRPRGRGLIEASLSRSPLLDADTIPRPRGRGLIEAARAVPFVLMPLAIPRPRGRGLIEACWTA